MKTMTQIRQENLKILCSGYKNQAAFAEFLDKTPGYVSQLLIGACKFGEKAARNIEKVTGKPDGWMDTDHENSANDAIDNFIDIYKALSPENKKMIETMMLSLFTTQEKTLTTPAPHVWGGGGCDVIDECVDRRALERRVEIEVQKKSAMTWPELRNSFYVRQQQQDEDDQNILQSE